MRVAIYTLGCKVNQYETQAMEQELVKRGHELVAFTDTADAYIVNTCSVTAVSDKKSRQMIRRCKKGNPDAVIAACGCYVQTHAEEAKKLGIELVAGTAGRMEFLDLLEQAYAQRKQLTLLDDALKRKEFEVLPAGGMTTRTRAMLKVEDGCQNFCTYCIIPFARGPVRSVPMDIAVEQAEKLRQEGYREIVVTGIEISSYGRDFGDGTTLIDLLEKLSEAAGEMRIRLGSLEPRTITEDFCRRAAKLSNLCPHFHLSLQSGCDETLKRMNRRGTGEEIRALFRTLRRRIPGLVLRTSLITGLPYEDEAAFDELCDFLREVKIQRAGAFPYSPEEGTPAAEMPNRVDTEEAQRRAELVVDVQSAVIDEFNESRLGDVAEVLCDGYDEQSMLFVGRSYAESPDIDGRIYFSAEREVKTGEFVNVRLTGTMDGELTGELYEEG